MECVRKSRAGEKHGSQVHQRKDSSQRALGRHRESGTNCFSLAAEPAERRGAPEGFQTKVDQIYI